MSAAEARTRAVVVGAGGHALVVADALLAAGVEVLGFTDRDAGLHGTERIGLPVLGDDAGFLDSGPEGAVFALGLGSLGDRAGVALRQRVAGAWTARGREPVTVVHPAAVVAPSAALGAGSQVLAGAVVNATARVGAFAIVNTRAVVEHGVTVGDWAHVAPGAVVAGDATIGEGAHVGAGAVVLQGLRVGPGATIGAGAVLTSDAPNGVWVGVPARRRD